MDRKDIEKIVNLIAKEIDYTAWEDGNIPVDDICDLVEEYIEENME